MLGDYKAAEKEFLVLLKLVRVILGEDDPKTLTIVQYLADTYIHLDKYSEAEDLIKQLLYKKRELFGHTHHSTLSSMNNLAGIYANQDKHNDAEVLYKQCLFLRKVVLGESHPDTLDTMTIVKNFASMNVVDTENDSHELSKNSRRYSISHSTFINKKSMKNHACERYCLYCLKLVEGSLRCSKCRTALYCDKECQLKHWSVHKNSCHDSNDTENSDEKLHMKAYNHSKQGN